VVWWSSLYVVKRQIGVREKTGQNDGPQVSAYLRSVGLSAGNPWCMAVQYWAFDQVTSTPPILRSGLVRAVWNDAVTQYRASAQGRTASASLDYSRDGDLIVWGFLTSTSGHVERQIATARAGWVLTAAGNTTSGDRGNQRDGGGMYQRRRNLRHPLGRMVVFGVIGPSYRRTS
jgi:hypothetical protein